MRNGLIAHRQFSAPAANRWCWVGFCVHTHSRARSHDLGARILRHCSRSLSQPSCILTAKQLPLDAQPLAVTKSCCPYLLVLASSGAGITNCVDRTSDEGIPGSTVLWEHTRYFHPVFSPSCVAEDSGSLERFQVFSWPPACLRHVRGGVGRRRSLIGSPSGRLAA